MTQNMGLIRVWTPHTPHTLDSTFSQFCQFWLLASKHLNYLLLNLVKMKNDETLPILLGKLDTFWTCRPHMGVIVSTHSSMKTKMERTVHE